ncbi:hypothetical protein Q0601_00755 [Paracoccus onubensis]|uniref:hypothetical protein n=1 Tax=Paracoccus onubensis TaxID=1675788 RepID=UPI002731D09D|nr:hypothetical protein [Paracoccus onubensis]MDP0925691.1 hypothetical protein [Paracoccus onubensis]
MHIPAHITGTAVKPSWHKASDLTEDISDIYGDATGDYESAVTAHFTLSTQAVDGGTNDPDDWRYADWKDLIGAEIDGADGIRYMSRFDLNNAGVDTASLDGVV